MSEEEDVKRIHGVVAERLKTMYDCMRMIAQMTPEELKHSGHKTIDAGIVWTYRQVDGEIQKLWREHLKKYPD